MLNADIDGIDDLAAALNGIVGKARKTIGNEAVITALTRLEVAAKRHAEWSEDTGALKASIGIKVKPFRKGNFIFGVVGPRKGFERPDPSGKGTRNPVKYGHLVENGTSHSAPRAFMRPAFAETKDAMLNDLARVIGEGVKKEAERQAKRKRKTNTL
jgi:HK97 gp10 family phage protein